ncbi:splicing factor, CC1-like protein [Mytilinidion resinicola]|uniref:Splicing factor, CC1-like protein n=1 Tax=Mytilinidion resinicola TaxID=574789 RepID=A0A6A6Z4Q8_9PEZI|nr:splicing factor, CC1-like protein [Mytilinidion resinicola]KAF2816056.1 splicing factor, CC1-like protein [Mytilinidion resinicola]
MTDAHYSGGSRDSHHSNRHRSRSPRRRDDRRRGDFYRGGHNRSRSRSPDRHYQPRGGRRDRDRDYPRDRDNRYNRGGRYARRGSRDESPKRRKTPEPVLTEDERDRRTVFVQQLAARLETRHLFDFFNKVGRVKEAQIVKDRVSGRSKGVGYVEFFDEESVAAAIELTGQKLKGVPIIAQHTEAEKNRQARAEGAPSAASGVPFHRLYVGNVHFSITEMDLKNVFEPFGELEFVQLQKEETGRSRGYGFVQFRDPAQAKEALEKMNGFELAGRPIRVGLGNDKFTPESTANLLRSFNGQAQPQFQGSAFSGHGGRGIHAGGAGGSFDRTGGRDNDRKAGGASALDDTDVAGVNFNNYSRDSLMRKLARIEDPPATSANRQAIQPNPRQAIRVEAPMASRCIVLKDMYGSEEVEEGGPNWKSELAAEVRDECNESYGTVLHIGIDPVSTPGEVYVKFTEIAGGEKAIKGLNGRYFAGHMVTAEPVSDAMYNIRFPNSVPRTQLSIRNR